jgi:multidrug efflux system membrane fusion protein
VVEAEARVKAFQKSLEVYTLNKEFTRVTSPIDGQVSRYYLTLGNLVNQDQTLLTTIVSLDPIYAYFDMDERTLLRIRHAINEGKLKSRRVTTDADRLKLLERVIGALEMPSPGNIGVRYNLPAVISAGTAGLNRAPVATEIPLFLGLAGDEGYPHQGVINFANNRVNPNTGSISVRGIFANPKPASGVRLMSPGMFVRIRLPIGPAHPAVLIIDRAIQSDQGQKYVYVLDAENKTEYRRITTGALQPDGLRVIADGLKVDDWVVVGSLQQIRQNMEVKTQQIAMPSFNPSKGGTKLGAKGS